MKIDRHNYEEFFLLYIDNELNVDQKKQVEAFVLANPDMEEELIMLQQSKLVADQNFVFEGKESLMREESSINMSNYEEWLLLYTDNELTREQKSNVEQFAAAHPHVKEELNLFLQTKLEPQEIVFADKASLYKTEEKVRVVSMSWWRIAAAAVLLIAVGLGTYSIINNNKKASIETAGVNPSTNKPNQTGQKINNVVPGTNQEGPEINSEKNNEVAVKEIKNKVENKKPVIPSEKNINDNSAIAKNNEIKTPDPLTNIPNESTHVTTTDASAFMANNGDQQKQSVNNSGVTNDLSQSPNSKKLASIKDYVDEPGSFADNGNDENKKLRGFFRRATRFIERTTKVNPANDDNRVLIGSMAVSLK